MNVECYFSRLRQILSISLLLCVSNASSVLPPANAQTVDGTIAYLRDNDSTGDEIWLIKPDGSNNRRIWNVGEPDPNNVNVLSDLDWRPDASEIAFSSDHEYTCSRFDSDLYSIRSDGSGYRRITNGPICAALDSFPKGSVTVTVRKFNLRSPLYAYMQGAPVPLLVDVAQGETATLTFDSVADFGEGILQQAVVIWGADRWVAPIAEVDVVSGKTVHAGTVDVSGEGTEFLGAYVPSWHSDGSRLGYILFSAGSMYQVPSNPTPGDYGPNLLNLDADTVASADVMDWGPTPVLANQILYASHLNQGIYRVTEGADNTGTKLIDTGIEGVIDLQWLPDGSGFIYTRQNFTSHSNVYHYDFGSEEATQLTFFTNEFAIDISPSPDGKWIVFERSPTNALTEGDLWLMKLDGSELQLFIKDGMRPSWSLQEPQVLSNNAPVADAGDDQSVTVGTTVNLDGNGSDSDGHLPLSYGWQQMGGVAVVLATPDNGLTSFTAPATAGILTFTLIVTDSLGLASAPDTVRVTVNTQPGSLLPRGYLPMLKR
jgi:Tol biopolymer transport system component